jgi:integrase/recombinase XerD
MSLIYIYLEQFKIHCENRGLGKTTVKRYVSLTQEFILWLAKQKITDVREVTKEDILNYREYLLTKKDKKIKGETIAETTLQDKLNRVRDFFVFLLRIEKILRSPFEGLDFTLRRPFKRARKSISVEKINIFLDNIKPKDPFNLRDRTMFELLYGTGIRVGELCNLDVEDVDTKDNRLFIRSGKGNKDRIVPLGKNLTKWLDLYLKKGRLKLKKHARKVEERALFLTRFGRRILKASVWKLFKQHLEEAGIENTDKCVHMLRHSFATHMLENGAGIKQVKEILGHNRIQTTVCYTHFSIPGLRKILKQYHPRENELFHEFTYEERNKYLSILRKGVKKKN